MSSFSTASATALRALRDLGGSAWFGGALMGAAGLNAAADRAGAEMDRDEVVSAGWAAWGPIFRAAVAAHVLGSVAELVRTRRAGAAVGLGFTAAALGAQAGTMVLGGRKDAQDTVHALEWAIPALVAGSVVAGAATDRSRP
jgi:hypothetical protein